MSETDDARAIAEQLQVEPIRKRLARGDYTNGRLPATTVEADIAYLLAALAAAREAGRQHRCSGCDLRWTDLPGVELCGDCWRERQAALEVGRQQGLEEAIDEAAAWQRDDEGLRLVESRASIPDLLKRLRARAAAPRPQGK